MGTACTALQPCFAKMVHNAPKDDIVKRTRALLSDLDRLMMAFQSSR